MGTPPADDHSFDVVTPQPELSISSEDGTKKESVESDEESLPPLSPPYRSSF